MDGVDPIVEQRHVHSAVKVVGALLGCLGLLCVAAFSAGPTGTRVSSALGLYASAGSVSASSNAETGCPVRKVGCQSMILAKGDRSQATRNLEPFEALIVSDVIHVLSYEVNPYAQPSITFTASESLLGTLVAEIAERTLTVGAGCACLQGPTRDEITARIVNVGWPKSVVFRDASRGNLGDMTALSVSSVGAANLQIHNFTSTAVVLGCRDSAKLQIGSVEVDRKASFSASHSCNLAIAAGGADSSVVTVGDSASADLGTFVVQATQILASEAGRVHGQFAQRGHYEARSSSSLQSAVKEEGQAVCHDASNIHLQASGPVSVREEGACKILIDP